jgi:hypothetical protein
MATVGNDTLHLPPPVMMEARRWAEQDAMPLEQFVAQAVMEKIEALKTDRYFAERCQRADLTAFDGFLAKAGRETPGLDDAAPSDW